MTDFKETFAQLEAERIALGNKYKEAKKEAIDYIENVARIMRITKDEVIFYDGPAAPKKRAPSKPKYITPDGSISWSGKGFMKKELAEWLKANNKTLEDIKVC